MRWMMALVLFAGCADGMTLSMDAPDPGTAHDGSAAGAGGGGQGGAGGAAIACTATVDMLSGTATYVAGSVAAVDPSAIAPFLNGTETCGEWAPSIEQAIVPTVAVSGGMAGVRPMTIVSAIADTAGCVYTLRAVSRATGVPFVCDVTMDYTLTVP